MYYFGNTCFLKCYVCLHVQTSVQSSNLICVTTVRVSQVALVVKNPSDNAADVRNQLPSIGWKDPLEKEMAIYFSILA